MALDLCAIERLEARFLACQTANMRDGPAYARRVWLWIAFGEAVLWILAWVRAIKATIAPSSQQTGITTARSQPSASWSNSESEKPRDHRETDALYAIIDDLTRRSQLPNITTLRVTCDLSAQAVQTNSISIHKTRLLPDVAGMSLFKQSAPNNHLAQFHAKLRKLSSLFFSLTGRTGRIGRPGPARARRAVSGAAVAALNRSTRYETALIIGRALLRSLSPSEARAVIAHELGHLASTDCQLAARCQQLHDAWHDVQTGDSASANRPHHNSPYGVAAFARWYLRHLIALAVPLWHEAEYAADRFAAKLVGSKHLGHALCRIAIAQYRLTDTPASNISGHQILASCLAETPALADLHPSLRDRLQALGAPAQVPPPLTITAWDEFSG